MSSSLILHNNNEPIGLWHETKNGFYMITSNNQLCGWTKKKPQRTFQSQTCTKKLSRSLFGGLLLVWPLRLSESQWNHYNWEACSANQWDTLKTAMPSAGIGQQSDPNSSPWQCPTACCTINASKVEWNQATKFCLICHIHLTSRPLTTTSSSISTNFCRKNATTTSRMQKMFSKSSSNPEAQISFMLQE